jgi:hypothetical protein
MTHENTKKQFESRFPIKELSYERILHNKVQSDVCVLIPRGKKQFLWFTYMDVRNVCLIVDYKRNYNGSITIHNMTQCVCVFDESFDHASENTVFHLRRNIVLQGKLYIT